MGPEASPGNVDKEKGSVVCTIYYNLSDILPQACISNLVSGAIHCSPVVLHEVLFQGQLNNILDGGLE